MFGLGSGADAATVVSLYKMERGRKEEDEGSLVQKFR
jgi:hypothetical protein